MQQRSHRLSRQTHVHHHAEVHNGLDADEEEEDESDHIQPIVQRRKDQQTLTQSKLCPQCGIFEIFLTGKFFAFLHCVFASQILRRPNVEATWRLPVASKLQFKFYFAEGKLL